MTMFEETEGVVSMRRVLAFITSIIGCIAGILSIVFKMDWHVVASAFGVPNLVSVILLFFTTWSDIKSVMEVIKKW